MATLQEYKKRQEKEKDFIWHYTTLDTLEEILSSTNTLYATCYKELNDRTEIIRARNIFLDEIEKFEFPFDKSMFRRFIEPENVFLLSFSTDGDSLSQWRGYTHNGGIAIAFSSKELKECLKTHSDNNNNKFFLIDSHGKLSINNSIERHGYLRKCQYLFDDEMQQLANSNILSFLEKLKNMPCPSLKKFKFPTKSIVAFSEMLVQIRLTATWKNHFFINEEEVRYVISYPQKHQPQMEKIGKKNRIKTPWNDVKKLIKCIRVSPCGSPQETQTKLGNIREKYGLTCDIVESWIPYVEETRCK